MTRTISACFAVVLAVFVLTTASVPRNVAIAANETVYFCEIRDTDGAKSIGEVYGEDINDEKKVLKDRYNEDKKKWADKYKEWVKAVGRKPFPVPKPVPPRIKKLSRVPDTRAKRDRAFGRYKNKLEVWNVCIVTDMEGERKVKAIRRDKMQAEKVKLWTEFVEAMIEYAEARKELEGEDGDDDDDANDAPKKPSVRIVKAGLRSAGAADRYAEKLSKKLDAKEQAAEKEKAAEEEK